MSPDQAYLLVTQTKSGIGTKPKHRANLRALGLRGVGKVRVVADTPNIRGMIARVPHLVEVAPATAEQAAAQEEIRGPALAARKRSQGQDPG